MDLNLNIRELGKHKFLEARSGVASVTRRKYTTKFEKEMKEFCAQDHLHQLSGNKTISK